MIFLRKGMAPIQKHSSCKQSSALLRCGGSNAKRISTPRQRSPSCGFNGSKQLLLQQINQSSRSLLHGGNFSNTVAEICNDRAPLHNLNLSQISNKSCQNSIFQLRYADQHQGQLPLLTFKPDDTFSGVEGAHGLCLVRSISSQTEIMAEQHRPPNLPPSGSNQERLSEIEQFQIQQFSPDFNNPKDF